MTAKKQLLSCAMRCKPAKHKSTSDPTALTAWIEANVQRVHGQYRNYLDSLKQSGSRLYFSNRAHALNFLRQAAPTNLVDGSWLYGLCA